MSDVYDAATRSRVMRAVKSKDTRPERTVRSLLHLLGFRFRLHRKDLAGKPDIVLPRYRTVIFVHGCFFHGHNCKRGSREPKTNVVYWREKLRRNVERDQIVFNELSAQNWKVLTVWECELKDLEGLGLRLSNAITLTPMDKP